MSDKSTTPSPGAVLGEALDDILRNLRVGIGRLERAADRLAGKAKDEAENEEAAEEKATEEKPTKSKGKRVAPKSSAKEEKKELDDLLKALRPKLTEVKAEHGAATVKELIANYDNKKTLASLTLVEARGLMDDANQLLGGDKREEESEEW